MSSKLEYCIDWLTFIIDSTDQNIDNKVLAVVEDFNELMGTTLEAWEEGRGRYTFKDAYMYNGIEVLYHGAERSNTETLICVNISGSGCRAFEFMCQQNDVDDPIKELINLVNYWYLNVTRIDLAIDDHDNYLDMDNIYRISEQRYNKDGSMNDKCFWWGKFKTSRRIDATDEMTVYFGSPQSEIRIRIYDKAMQYKMTDHWVRVEVQLRKQKADAVFKKIDQNSDVTTVKNIASDILRTYLFFAQSLFLNLHSRRNTGKQRSIYATGGRSLYRIPARLI